MSKSKPVSIVLGAAFLASAISPLASAEVNPFSATPLSAGYDIVNTDAHEDKVEKAEGKCGEGKCGEGKDAEAKSAEGKCGEKS